MQSNDQVENNFFNLAIDDHGIIRIKPKEETLKKPDDPLLLLGKFCALLISLLDPAKEITGIIYHYPFDIETDNYRVLFESAKKPDFSARLQQILEWSATIKLSKIPVVAVMDGAYNSIHMAPMLWAHYIIGTTRTKIVFLDCSLGIFPGLGTTVYTTKRLPLEDAAKLLIKGANFNHDQALATGLLDAVVADSAQLRKAAIDWILTQGTVPTETNDINKKIGRQNNAKDVDQALESLKKNANLRFPGTSACFLVIEASTALSLEEALAFEASSYTSVLQNSFSLAIMRSMHYGVQQARTLVNQPSATQFSKIGIIGAGMMGAGIAFEVARSGMQAIMKDTTLELAQRGKAYTTKCCDKLISIDKMAATQKEAMEALIEPTDKIIALQGVDCIIEAVFEQEALKKGVIQESEPTLTTTGFFASNTTSLPISRLAGSSVHPENFIGMHFFSPVDRMPLVEIILGKQTSQRTLEKAKALALKLGKIPIVVHDSPAFFTSRIFFNYLLEAITILLEGIPAAVIEKEALNAGFAVSPLAVLDEISLPLMVHVYDQLPTLSSSQLRAYNHLKSMINHGRTGRKSSKGFYNYDQQTGKKQLWQDQDIRVSVLPQDTLNGNLQKRFLHVMALDSYRCLAEGVLDRPIDGDIGAILGVGYAAHTGGVFAHIDQTGLEQFVQDCTEFSQYGEQWRVPASLIALAEENFTFYDGFNSNWPLTKAKLDWPSGLS